MSTRKLMDFYKIFWNFPQKYQDKLGKLGDTVQYTNPIIFLIYAIGVTFYNSFYRIENPFKLLVVFVITYAITALIQVTLKFLFNQPRPRTEIAKGNQGINPDLNFDPQIDGQNSFPSGHTMSAMTGGMFWFQMTFGYAELGILFGIIGFTLGLLTALSRIVQHAHWVRDVGFSIVVSVLAYFIACLFL